MADRRKELLVSPRVTISFSVTEILFWMLTVPSWKRSVALAMAAIQPPNTRGLATFPGRAFPDSLSYVHALTLHICLTGA